MKAYINPDGHYFAPLAYVIGLLSEYTTDEIRMVDQESGADFVWNHESEHTQPIAMAFHHKLTHENDPLPPEHLNNPLGLMTDGEGRPDLLSSIFYMVNCIQELNATDDLDEFGRFKFRNTYQFAHGTIEENTVGGLVVRALERFGLNPIMRKSRVFVSHDIDLLYGSLIQDGFWAIKHAKPGVLLKIIFHHFLRNPHWRNIDRILKINSEYDVRSTFFWLVIRGTDISGRVKNADYRISEQVELLRSVSQNGSRNGLHKASGDTSFLQELNRLAEPVTANRYHFLKFRVHEAWKDLENSTIRLDASLGFSEHYGFRNSFADAFMPYNVLSGKKHNFVCVPLTYMDVTFRNYLKTPLHRVADIIIGHLEENQFNSTHGLLWHNNFFTDYKYGGYLAEYKKVLAYIYESKLESITPDEIINQHFA